MRRSSTLTIGLAAASVAFAAFAPCAALAQIPVVQPIPGGDGVRLNTALSRLARNPRDVEALIDAGVASLAAGDGDAAIGFYQKADTLSPGNARIKAGLAGAYVLGGDPVSALPLFDEAERLGMIDGARLSDRGLAYDMVGDPLTAQRYYREALMAGPNDEASRRLALSQAISGDRRAMEVTLGPLLQRQDKAAWRTRAFALAVLNQVDEADAIARSTMPPDLAGAIGNYLRYMPKLTQAQQAAAGNLGRFPRAAEIGRDDPRLAALVRTRPAPVAAAAQPVKLASKDDRKRAKQAPTQTIVVPPPASPLANAAPVAVNRTLPAPVVAQPVPVRVTNSAELPPTGATAAVTPAGTVASPVASPQTQVAAAPPPPAVAPMARPATTVPQALPPAPVPVPVPVQASAPASGAASSQPGFATLDTPSASFALKPAVPPAAPLATPPAPPPVAAAALSKPPSKSTSKTVPATRSRSLAEVFADLTPPSREAEPEAGAVDLRKLNSINPAAKAAAEAKLARDTAKACEAYDPDTGKLAKGAKVKLSTKQLATCKDLAAKEEKAKAPANPSRLWVQVATGRDRKGLAFDWRKMAKDDPALFKARKAYVSAWGQTNRLLTGPFESAAQANAYIGQLKKAGVDGAFVWNSPAGQVVDTLPGA